MGKKAPSMPPPPPAPPTREDPAIEDAKKRLRFSEMRRGGRKASILTPAEGLGDVTVDRPTALSGTLGGS